MTWSETLVSPIVTSIIVLADPEVSDQLARWLGLDHGACRRVDGIGALGRREREIRPDLIVYDLDVSGDAGFKGVESLGELFPSVPILLIIGPDSESIHLAAIEAGATEVVAKSTWNRRGVRLAAATAVRRTTPSDDLQRIAGKLAEANNDLHDFANLIAHDLRSPIRTSRVLSERLVQRLQHGDPEVDELGGRVLDGLAHIDSIVQSMLDYTTLRFDLPPAENFRLRDAVEPAVADVVAAMNIDPACIEIHTDPEQSAVGSLRMIRRVVQHLVDNAFVHHPLRDDAMVSVLTTARAGRAVITVSDNGAGVPSDAMTKVFQPMQRLAVDGRGNGFGLSICRRIVSGYGGSIFIEPRSIIGTTVVVELLSEA